MWRPGGAELGPIARPADGVTWLVLSDDDPPSSRRSPPLGSSSRSAPVGSSRRRRLLVAVLLAVAALAVGSVVRSGGASTPRRSLADGGEVRLDSSLEVAPASPTWSVDLGRDVRVIRADRGGDRLLVAFAPLFEIGPVTLAAFSLADGRRAWSVDLRLLGADRWAVAGETVVVGGDDLTGQAVATGYDAIGGGERWTTVVGPDGAAQPSVDPARPDVVLVSVRGSTVALDAATGQRRWAAAADALLYAGSLVVLGVSGQVGAVGEAGVAGQAGVAGEVVARDRLSGEVRWRQSIPAASVLTLGDGGDVVVVSTGETWIGLDRGDGRRRWEVPDRRKLTFVGNLGDDGVAVGDGRTGAVLDASRGTARLRLDVSPAAVVQTGDGQRRLLAVDGFRSFAVDHSTGEILGAAPDPGAVTALSADALYALNGESLTAYDLTGLQRRWWLPDRSLAPGADPGGRAPLVIFRGRPVVVLDGGDLLVAYD